MAEHEFKVGDVVMITESDDKFYSVGDFATIISIDSDGDFWADFKGFDGQEVFEDGEWCIGDDSEFELVQAAPISEKVELVLDEPNRN